MILTLFLWSELNYQNLNSSDEKEYINSDKDGKVRTKDMRKLIKIIMIFLCFLSSINSLIVFVIKLINKLF
jgi:hypothetical protein